MLTSMVCRYDHFLTEWYGHWAGRLPLARYGIDPAPRPGRPHRKAWEWCAIAQALAERDMLRPGRTGCGFAVGTEPLPAAFAAAGAQILATDQAMTAEAGAWVTTNQHAASLDSLFQPELIDRAGFEARVRFRPADMRALGLPWEERFDFLWSSCSIEHLGSLEAGWQFVEGAMQLLRPGGVAVHTTEFNVSSNEATLSEGDSVIYRRQDIEALDRRLRARGYGLSCCDFFAGDHPHDLDFDIPPYGLPDRQHVKLLLGGHVSTSMLLILRKGKVEAPTDATGQDAAPQHPR
ncbi:class I SAM-dependent methyltransferase [Roseicella aquatilis]|nr:class I SAM-dependent methyltransferase [Roseicella aquatilis]